MSKIKEVADGLYYAECRRNMAQSRREMGQEIKEQATIHQLERELTTLCNWRDKLRAQIAPAERQVARLETALSTARNNLDGLYNELRELEGADETNS